MTVTIDTPPPDMSGSAARVAHMRNWIEQLEADIAQLTMQRDALWKAIGVLDPDSKIPFAPLDVTPAVITTATPSRTSSNAATKKPKADEPPTTRPPITARDARATQISTAAARGRPPLEEIAAVYLAAKAAKKAPGPAMAEHFNVPSSTVSNWPTALRKAGLIGNRGRGRPAGSPNKPKPAGDAQVTPISSAKSATPKRDWAEVAARIIEFRDQGVSVQEAIAKLYKVPTSTAKQWMKHCRESGLVKPLVAGLKVLEDNTAIDNSTAVYSAREVATAYLDAIRTNLRPIQHVADSLGIDKSTAVSWVRQARLDGELPATSIEPQLPEEERRKLLDMSKPESIA